MTTPGHCDEAHVWLHSGLSLLDAVPDGLEGGIRMQQAALALQHAMRCGLSPELVAQSLRQAVVTKLAQTREELNMA